MAGGAPQAPEAAQALAASAAQAPRACPAVRPLGASGFENFCGYNNFDQDVGFPSFCSQARVFHLDYLRACLGACGPRPRRGRGAWSALRPSAPTASSSTAASTPSLPSATAAPCTTTAPSTSSSSGSASWTPLPPVPVLLRTNLGLNELRIEHMLSVGCDYCDVELLLADYLVKYCATEAQVALEMPVLFRRVRALGYFVDDEGYAAKPP